MITRQDRVSLFIMGVISILIGLIPQVQAALFYPDYVWFSSISASATTQSTTSMVLPLGLGAVLLFCMVYKGYCKLDNWITNVVALGLFFVVAQPCLSRWTQNLERVGLFGLPPNVSGIVHNIGAFVGFGAMIFWVFYLFTKGRNKVRKIVYYVCSVIALTALGTLFQRGWRYHNVVETIHDESLFVWIIEVAILIPMGAALIIKSDIVNTLRKTD